MILPNIFKKETLPQNVTNAIALDIGTEVLKVMLFDTNAQGVVIKKISRIQQQRQAMNKGVIQNLNTVLENCRLALREVSSDLDPENQPKYAVMGIAGEYVQGVSIVVNYEREDKFDKEVDEKEQHQIISRVHQQILDGGKDDLAKRTGLVSDDIEILHITITGMEIGGITVDSLVGLRGRNVKLNFYASFAPKTYTSALRSVAKDLGLEVLGIVSQPFSVARGFSGATGKSFSAIFIDIGGGTTDVAVVDKGSVIDTQMFAFGGRVFTKELAKELNIDYRHAEQRKIKYSEGKLEQRLENQVKKVVYPVAQMWMKTLKSALEVNHELESFPTKVYLCGGGAILPEIKEVMMEFPWTKLLPFATVPKIEIFYPNKLENIQDGTNDLIYTYDVTPASLTLFAFDKIKNPQRYNK